MISDESSSDSETGRFKCKPSEKNELSTKKDEGFGSSRRGRNIEPSRDFERHRGERRFERSRERTRHYRYSPPRRRNSSDRNPGRRRSRERYRFDRERRKSKERSNSRDKHRHSRSVSHKKSPDRKLDLRDEIRKENAKKRDLKEEIRKTIEPPREKISLDRSKRSTAVKRSLTPDNKTKRSSVHKPEPSEVKKRKSDSPIVIDEHVASDTSDERVQSGSYYSMIPAVVKEKSEESSEIDSSDDERLRAKLLNLEKELHKTRKKKHKKKNKKSSKIRKEDESSAAVEVTSTTDIKTDVVTPTLQVDLVEVSSTQKSVQKDSSEEGEISSDDDSQVEIDPTDLRHKLKRSVNKKETNPDICGPALPPHLETKYKSVSPNVEGPALPPHLKTKEKNIGPTIPADMREILAKTTHEIIDSSEESDHGIGPLPVGSEEKWSDAHKRLEERALDIKIKNLEGNPESKDVKSREKWMLELPEGKAKILGLEKRVFRAKEGPDMSDRSSWTDTPEDKARKAAGIVKEEDPDVVMRREARAKNISDRDLDQDQAVRKHKKKHKREESLLEIHQKKLKKKKKKEDKDEDKKERRPFSRDVDLQVNRFDDAQKRSIIKKAQNLDSRFSRGEAKYL